MAKLMLQPYNFLALDEPTNHMDMRSKDVLKNALMHYDGTLLVVSHDREFLDGLVSKVYEFRDGRVKEYLGGINDFLRQRKIENLKEIERKAMPAPPATSVAASAPKSPKKEPAKSYEEKKMQERQRRKLKNNIAHVEAHIQQHEQTIAAMDVQLAQPDAQPLNNDFFQRYEREKRALEQAMYEWEILCDEG
jgi:ATP-binding cassette subfamily F protein 3